MTVVHRFTEPTRPARVIVLGAGGFIAPELQRLLEEHGVAVYAVGTQELDLTAEGSGARLADLLTPQDSVVMAAALTPDKGRDTGTLMKNLRMAENVCGALARTAPAHLLYLSSDAVYDGRLSSLLNEDSTCEPTDLYAVMHIAREKMLAQACGAANVPLAIVRPCAVYGARDTHNSYGPNRFVRTALKDGRISLFGEGEERRHHVSVSDVARIVSLCLHYRSCGTLNAITGEAVSFHSLAEMIVGAVGRPVTLECLPRGSAITHRHFDSMALTRSFPQFAATPLSAGIRQMITEISCQH